MLHERLDIAYWKAFFSVPRLREEAHGRTPEAGVISGPYDIAVLEQLRDATYANLTNVKRVPTDVFVWYRGEPEQRAITKIGGLPYRIEEKPWPLAPSGDPMTFVAQICFADSHDISPALPGDILLIFTEAKAYTYEGQIYYDFMGEAEDDSYLKFEWVSLDNFPLIASQHIPETGLRIMPCYGAIHRTWDYPHVDGFAYPGVTEATKIGGICPWLDDEYDGPGVYLSSLSSLGNKIYQPFPFLNVPDPISWNEWSRSDRLMIGDLGLINLFLKSDGTLRWSFHTH